MGSAALEALAEGGDVAPLTSILGLNVDGTTRSSTVITAPAGFAGAPVLDPGETQSQVVDVMDARFKSLPQYWCNGDSIE